MTSMTHLLPFPSGSRHLKVAPVSFPGQQSRPPLPGQPFGPPVSPGVQERAPSMHCSDGIMEGAELGEEVGNTSRQIRRPASLSSRHSVPSAQQDTHTPPASPQYEGADDGTSDGKSDGIALGSVLGPAEGEVEGMSDGVSLGGSEGSTEGGGDGKVDGASDGLWLGRSDGATLGLKEGLRLGAPLGNVLGS